MHTANSTALRSLGTVNRVDNLDDIPSWADEVKAREFRIETRICCFAWPDTILFPSLLAALAFTP